LVFRDFSEEILPNKGRLRRVKIRLFIFLFFAIGFCLTPEHLLAQINILGKPGYILTPASRWDQEKPQGIIGLAYIPQEYAVNLFMDRYYDELMMHATVDLTPFLRFTFNLTYLPEIPERIGVGDRHIDLSVRLWKERKVLPSLTLILTPPIGEADFLSYNLAVASKQLGWAGRKQVEISAGYGLKFRYFNASMANSRGLKPGFYSRMDWKDHYLNGFFAGAKFMPIPWLGFTSEFDTRDFNGGVFLTIAKMLTLQLTAYGFERIGGMFHLQLPLTYKPRELRRYGKK
jgi:hypothetical protein